MKILVDEMPKEASECMFSSKFDFNIVQDFVCMFDSPCLLEAWGKCPYLKPLDKPVKDDCK